MSGMGVRITDSEAVALYDSVTGYAFGPTFPSEEAAQDFLQFTEEYPDPRTWSDQTMDLHFRDWVAARGEPYGLELGHPA